MATINQDKEKYNLLFTIISLITVILIGQKDEFIVVDGWNYAIIMGLILTALLRISIIWFHVIVLNSMRFFKDQNYDPGIKLNASDFNMSTSIIMCSYYSTSAYSYTSNPSLIALIIIGSFLGTYLLLKLLTKIELFGEFSRVEVDSSISEWERKSNTD